MSSKVLPPDGRNPITPFEWRRVNASREDGPTASELEHTLQAEMAKMQAQFETRLHDTRAAALEEGENSGRKQASEALQPVIEKLARTIDDLALMRARLRQEAEADMVKLSLAIARRVLRRELAIDPEALHGLILAALEKLQGQETSRVKVHPSQATLVQSCLQKSVTGGMVTVIADPACEAGAVVFETQRGNLDVSVESQLQEIERGLADCLRKRP